VAPAGTLTLTPFTNRFTIFWLCSSFRVPAPDSLCFFRPPPGLLSRYVPERMGFEPMVLCWDNDLANRRLQPLSHLSHMSDGIRTRVQRLGTTCLNHSATDTDPITWSTSSRSRLGLRGFFLLLPFSTHVNPGGRLSVLSTTGSPTVTLLRLITNHHPVSHVLLSFFDPKKVRPTLRIQTILSH
jgi:hypothetical protein